MISTAEEVQVKAGVEADTAVAQAAYEGLLASPKRLVPWLFYDEAGSELFEQITLLPEYYLTRTERGILADNIAQILMELISAVTVVELGAGTATKTGIVLRAAAASQRGLLYQPIDVSPTALDEAQRSLTAGIPGLTVKPVVANYVTTPIRLEREPDHLLLALYIGSSIGNFSPAEAHGILNNLRAQMQPGDALLLGTDLAPGGSKTVESLVAAYDDSQGVTAAFNLNVLSRLNRELGTDFALDQFAHEARWNAAESRIEMHLRSLCAQTVRLPASDAGAERMIQFAAGETIHTENSYKFDEASLAAMLTAAGFGVAETFMDRDGLFAVTLALAG